MKLVVAALLLVSATPVLAQDATAIEQAPMAEAPAAVPDTARSPAAAAQAGGKIILYRPESVMGLALGCPIRYKGQELVELGRGKFAEWDVAPGRYILTNKTASVEVHVDPGETRYVRCSIKPGFMTGRSDLQIVDAETYAQHSAEYDRKDVAAIR